MNAHSTLEGVSAHTNNKNGRYMSDDQLVNQYDSGYRGKQFREEMKDRLGSTGTGGKSFNNQNHLKRSAEK